MSRALVRSEKAYVRRLWVHFGDLLDERKYDGVNWTLVKPKGYVGEVFEVVVDGVPWLTCLIGAHADQHVARICREAIVCNDVPYEQTPLEDFIF